MRAKPESWRLWDAAKFAGRLTRELHPPRHLEESFEYRQEYEEDYAEGMAEAVRTAMGRGGRFFWRTERVIRPMKSDRLLRFFVLTPTEQRAKERRP